MVSRLIDLASRLNQDRRLPKNPLHELSGRAATGSSPWPPADHRPRPGSPAEAPEGVRQEPSWGKIGAAE